MPISVTYVTEEIFLLQIGSGILTNFWSPLLQYVCLFVCFLLSNQGLLFFFWGDVHP